MKNVCWESQFDGLVKFREWILNYSIEIEGKEEVLATAEELDAIDNEAKKTVKAGQKQAWENYQKTITDLIGSVLPLVENLKGQNAEIENYITSSINWFQKLRKMFSIW
jgi:hypothetical protein